MVSQVSTGVQNTTQKSNPFSEFEFGTITKLDIDRFIVPTVSIHWGATMVHGMKVKNGCLVRRGEDLGADEDAAAVLGDFFR